MSVVRGPTCVWWGSGGSAECGYVGSPSGKASPSPSMAHCTYTASLSQVLFSYYPDTAAAQSLCFGPGTPHCPPTCPLVMPSSPTCIEALRHCAPPLLVDMPLSTPLAPRHPSTNLSGSLHGCLKHNAGAPILKQTRSLRKKLLLLEVDTAESCGCRRFQKNFKLYSIV